MCNDCKTHCKKQIKFFDTPNILAWLPTDNEVTLYEKTINLCKYNKNYVTVNAIIATEVSEMQVDSGHIRYKLYIDNVQVAQAGYEADLAEFAPNLETSPLLWGGEIKCKKTLVVKVTAQIFSNGIVSANIDNSVGNFQGSKGAFLRIVVL